MTNVIQKQPTMIDALAVKRDFPVLNQAGEPSLVFLDSAASSQKPQAVIDALVNYYATENANIHRGVYRLSELATAAYEGARAHVARFINAAHPSECVFVRNTTEALNLVASSWGSANLGPGDVIAVTEMEHHSNFVPWQLIAERTGAEFAVIRVTPDGAIDHDSFDAVLSREPKLVAFTQVSNSLGTINPAKAWIERIHAAGAIAVVDAAQSAPHMAIDVQDLDADFLALSSHKMLGPMGTGVLYGKRTLLNEMPPYQGGGSMIRKVTIEKTTWADVPAKFEAGTPAVADAVGFDAALTYLEDLGLENVLEHEHMLAAAAIEALAEIPGVTVLGPEADESRAGVVSFLVDGVHPHDVSGILDEHGVAVRAGHHCTQPLMHAMGVNATTRASFYVYNTEDDVVRLTEGIRAVQRVFA